MFLNLNLNIVVGYIKVFVQKKTFEMILVLSFYS